MLKIPIKMGINLAFLILATLFASVELVQVTVTQGTLEGEELVSKIGNTTYYSFKGIPYATPPVGVLRFQAPQPPTGWTGVRDATSHGASCPQIDIFTNAVNLGSEDCLFLNVYTPVISPSTPLAVMIFIYGGGFVSGSGNSTLYGPDHLMAQNVILVTLNYRLDTLGFLSLGTEKVPGNAGMKDQVAAMQWVKDNIANFGGDPNCITIFGQSAGSASVAYHLLSPLSKNLFNRAIMMSGVPLCDFTQEYKPVERAFILGGQNGIYTDDPEVLLDGLQKLPVEKLLNTNSSILTSEEILSGFINLLYTVPVHETNHTTNNTFLPEDKIEMLVNGTLNEADVMIGFTKDEAMTIVTAINTTYLPLFEHYQELFVPSKWFFEHGPKTNLKVGKMIREYYFQNKTMDANVIEKFIEYTSDSAFKYDILRFMHSLPAMSGKTRYFYQFSMSSAVNIYGNQGNAFGLNNRVAHLDDTFYLLSSDQVNVTALNSTELELINTFNNIMANFAKYGNPTPENSTLGVSWPQFDTVNQSYLDIGNTLTVGTAPGADMMTFWQTVFESVGKTFYYNQ